MIKLLIDIFKSLTIDAWGSFKERRYYRKVEKQSVDLIDKYGVIGAFIKSFESALSMDLQDNGARYLLDDFVNFVLPQVRDEYRIEMDEDWEVLVRYCEHYGVDWLAHNYISQQKSEE
tara:strand:- start:515 stop:868 length:354 start_codon:yes stop_codon:yes gene_type:complete